uniref:Uncharacterized protein n=1 Tax=Leersia perrieri TaxID=77586 RepID=A0A0D9XVS0_9ORYZ
MEMLRMEEDGGEWCWKKMMVSTTNNKQLLQRSTSMPAKKEEKVGRGRRLKRSVSGRVREQRARLYIMRRCVSMLLSSACAKLPGADHDDY